MRKLILIITYLMVFILTILALTWLDSQNKLGKLGHQSEPTASSEPSAATPTALPQEPSVYDGALQMVDGLIQADIDAGFPGAVLLISRGGQTIFLRSYGNLKIYEGHDRIDSPLPMRTDTVFDVASLTKVYATTLALMKLVDEGKLSIDSYVSEYLPGFDKDSYNQITIRQLMNHTSGFPSDVKFFRPDVLQGEAFYSTNRTVTMGLLADVPLESAPGQQQRYSDIGYMVLGAVIEQITGTGLDAYVRANLYGPLGIASQMSFNPLEHGFSKYNIACTERLGNTRDNMVDFPGIRNDTLQGEVHDEKAYYSMGGISGHAGLFADAQAVNTLNQMLLNGGLHEDKQILSAQTIEQFTTLYDDATYQLGFASAAAISSLKNYVPQGALCHTGWTGAFSLIDPQNDLSIVLLTNKRHSEITDGDFEGARFETGKYYKIIAAVYASLGLTD